MKPSPEVENLLKQARVLRDMGRTRDSLPLLERALATAPFDADMLCHLSLAYFDIGEWEKSLAAAEKALSTNPFSEWAYRLQSTSLREAGRNEEALTAARNAARYMPHHPFVLAILGCALLACKQIEEAEIISLHMAEVAPQSVITHLLLAEVNARKQRWAKVEHHARVALRIQAESDEAYRWLGYALSNQKQHWQAIQAYLAALRIEPANHKARTGFQNQCLQIGLQQIPTNLISVGMPVLAITLQHRGFSATVALLASTGYAVLLMAILTYLVPVLLMLFQPEYRRLPVTTQRLIVQQCRKNWFKAVEAITGTIFISLLFLWLFMWAHLTP